ncbi:M48 family metallopeptidase [Azotosporobacter soli]|uniref:M48 family metallopeptidase n=1 Tax=Azotosporobacter soli TaxID=3055040 RepID=UPI0031FE6BFE
MKRLSFLDHPIPHHIVYHPRRRYVSFIMRADGCVEIRSPIGAKPEKLQQLLANYRDHLPAPPAAEKAPDNAIYYRGLLYDIILKIVPACKAAFFQLQDDGTIHLTVPAQDTAASHFEECLIRESIELFRERTAHFCLLLSVSVRHISIRDLKTRWGSCSPHSASIRYNWRLIMAPPQIFDYIVIHELAHLHVPNHSQAFWQVVAQHDPDFRQHRKWLRLHGNQLFLPLNLSSKLKAPPGLSI